MIVFLAGRYHRQKPLPPTTARCARCQYVGHVRWERTYRTAHFLFYPLFSFGEQTTATCVGCGYSAIGEHPFSRPSRPFFDRLGWTIPAALAAFFVVCGSVSGARSRPSSVETNERLELERHLAGGETWGADPEARALADGIANTLMKEGGIRPADLGVAVFLTGAESSRRVFIDCQYSGMTSMGAKERAQVAKDLARGLRPKLGHHDRVVFAMKERGAYTLLVQGVADEAWDVDATRPSGEDIDTAMRIAAGPVAVSTTTVTGAELAK